ncbi:SDR family NAD(P)-dependent oxidoreductase [Halioxenophilus aromaticivorans]|uniref:SDR family oxidoreductase n=1 Tax=Halioxenophilus aromaticivorans TaxID=1306992 RepID=A0AAV3U3J4_9ALTE
MTHSSTNTATVKQVAILGGSGAIGNALVRVYQQQRNTRVWCLSRSQPSNVGDEGFIKADVTDEASLLAAAQTLKQNPPLDTLIIATGALHSEAMQPEKSLAKLEAEAFLESIQVNTLGPALAIKHLLPLLDKGSASRCGVLSARVGSIGDNRLGGWYSYRSAKAALNMFIKTAAVELARSHKHSVLVGLHPGTVDSELSKPFQRNVAPQKLFTPSYSAECLMAVLGSKTNIDSGQVFAWDNTPIPN